MNKQICKNEVEILIKFFNNTNGQCWKVNKGWQENIADVNLSKGSLDWFGTKWVKGHLVEICLPDNGLNGTIPSIISSLKKLRILKLMKNKKLRGSLPKSIFGMKKLQYCYLNDTSLKDTLPTELAHTFEITQYKSQCATVMYLTGERTRWIVDISETEMFMIHAKLKNIRNPPRKEVVIKQTAFNATGPERKAAAIKLQRIYRGKLARRALRSIMYSSMETKVDDNGNEYYVNTRNGEIFKEKPKILAEVEEEKLLEDSKIAEQEDEIEEDRKDWQEVEDGFGNIYFYNPTTNESRWDAPKFRDRLDEELIKRYGSETTPDERYKLLFLDVDKDCTGEIDKDEFTCLCGELGMPLSSTQIDDVMKELDTSGDGLLSQEELTYWLKNNY